jgi:hypothetical protein
MFAIVLCETADAQHEPGRRVLLVQTLDREIGATTADGRPGRFRITGENEIIDGREHRVYRYVEPDRAALALGDSRPRRAMHNLLNPETALAHGAEMLARRYRDVPPDTVARTVTESYQTLARTARITIHLPNLAIHRAGNTLADITNSSLRG